MSLKSLSLVSSEEPETKSGVETEGESDFKQRGGPNHLPILDWGWEEST